MNFIKIKQLLEYGVGEIFTYPEGPNHIVYLAFRRWTSAKMVENAAKYLNDTQVELAIYYGKNGKFDVSLRSPMLTQSININNILGGASILSLSEQANSNKIKILLYIYYDEDRIIDGKIDFKKEDNLWVEIPLNVASVKISV
jgi:hypothetical protein